MKIENQYYRIDILESFAYPSVLTNVNIINQPCVWLFAKEKKWKVDDNANGHIIGMPTNEMNCNILDVYPKLDLVNIRFSEQLNLQFSEQSTASFTTYHYSILWTRNYSRKLDLVKEKIFKIDNIFSSYFSFIDIKKRELGVNKKGLSCLTAKFTK